MCHSDVQVLQGLFQLFQIITAYTCSAARRCLPTETPCGHIHRFNIVYAVAERSNCIDILAFII